MKALAKQLRYELQRFKVEKNSIETLFIGGGTPSTVAPELYEDVFQIIRPYFQKDIEITSEANPNSATKEWLKGMAALGVNRISFGVQSFNEKKLKLLNRAHTPKIAVEAVYAAQHAGFKNISLDLIYGVQGDDKALLLHDLKTAFSLPINHLSAYALTIEAHTPFEKRPEMAQEELELTQWLFDTIEQHGFEQYEISNFGTYKSLHNLGYWQYKDYIGVGAGAVGKYKDKRFYPVTEIESYIQNPLNIKEEHLSQEDIQIEKMFLGFRSCVGVNTQSLNDDQKIKASILVEEKKILLQEGILYNLDFLLADELALFLTS